MSLVVRPHSVAVPAGAAPAGASVKWLWAAIGALGACVLALGATLAVQQRGSAQGPAAPAAQLAAVIENPRAPEPVAQAPAARTRPAPSTVPAASPAPARPSGMAQPVAAQAPLCATCGRVESVQAVQQAAPATGVGAVAGGVIGGVLGNQVGKGSGRTAATVLGAVGGGYLGHTVEQRTRTTTVYQMRVRMDDGSVRSFTRSQPVAEGTPVRVEGRTFRVDGSADHRTAQPVRVVDNQY